MDNNKTYIYNGSITRTRQDDHTEITLIGKPISSIKISTNMKKKNMAGISNAICIFKLVFIMSPPA